MGILSGLLDFIINLLNTMFAGGGGMFQILVDLLLGIVSILG